MRTLPFHRYAPCLIALTLAGLLAACTGPAPPESPFAGAWSNAERQQIVFRDNTVVQQPAGAPPTALSPATCEGKFQFAYARRSRDALIALAPRQPDQRARLAQLLVRPDYPVAELGCGDGGTTYVLLDDRDLVAIHRDADIVGVEQMSRS
ncbi:MAG: hypothetical protein JO058_19960 [Alphaproteobacteria bacterium]|nr:hypothetical protein [Alphaproteobacteria bacterium]MBV9966989.1 hypothetical protein [Alphaproteobacteria bacterium]